MQKILGGQSSGMVGVFNSVGVGDLIAVRDINSWSYAFAVRDIDYVGAILNSMVISIPLVIFNSVVISDSCW